MGMSLAIDDFVAAKPLPVGARGGRRLTEKVLIAFHHACDQGDLRSAEELLAVAGRVLSRDHPGLSVERRRCREALVAAHERLWHLRHRFEDLS
jgi:hypothetical protein